MAEDNILRHIPWEDCNMRQQELEGVKKVKEWRPDALGHMKEKVHPDNPKADLGSDLLLKYALQRRGMAFEQALIMKFEVHELLVDRLLTEYLRTPPAGYRVINLDQLLRTDKEIFTRMAEETRGGIVADALGNLPLETALKKVLYEPGVQMFLLPMPSAGPNAAAVGGASQQAEQAPTASREAAKRAAARLAADAVENSQDPAAKGAWCCGCFAHGAAHAAGVDRHGCHDRRQPPALLQLQPRWLPVDRCGRWTAVRPQVASVLPARVLPGAFPGTVPQEVRPLGAQRCS